MPSNHLGFLIPSDLLALVRPSLVRRTIIAATFHPVATVLPCCLARTHVGLAVTGAAVVVHGTGGPFCLAAPPSRSALQIPAAIVIRSTGIIVCQISAAFVVAAA